MIDSLELLKELISINSITGGEGKIIAFLKELLLSNGFSAKSTKSGALVASIKGKRAGKRVLFDSHVDTVGVGEKSKWRHDPFDPFIEDGKIYGRGASDMKGGLAASISAISSFSSLDFPGDLYIALIPEEERFEGIVSEEVIEEYHPDYVVIAESTDGKLNIGQRGRCEIALVANGISVHSANPEKGKNAIVEMNRALNALSKLDLKRDDLLGSAILVPTDIVSYPYPGMSIIPERVTLTFDRRTLPGETRESILSEINGLLKNEGIDAEAKIAFGETETYNLSKLSSYRFFPAWKESEDSDIVKRAKAGLDSLGLFKGYSHYGFCTNGSSYGKYSIPLIGYGPGKEEYAHIYNEFIELESLKSATEGMVGIIRGLLGIL